MEHHHEDLEEFSSLIRRGYRIDAVTSTDDAIVLTLRRQDEKRTLSLGAAAARALLESEPSPLKRVRA